MIAISEKTSCLLASFKSPPWMEKINRKTIKFDDDKMHSLCSTPLSHETEFSNLFSCDFYMCYLFLTTKSLVQATNTKCVEI